MPNYNAPYTKLAWPQDRAGVPPYWGALPEIDGYNRKWVKRDFYCISGRAGPIGSGQSVNAIETIPDYGDFWMSSIAVRVTDDALETPITADNATVTLRDIKNDYSLFYPYVRTPFLGQPGNGRLINIIEPYCFTRNSGIELVFTLPAKAAFIERAYFYTLCGWLEYEHASNQ